MAATGHALPTVLQLGGLLSALAAVLAIALGLVRGRIAGTAEALLATIVLCAAQMIAAVELLSLLHVVSGPALWVTHVVALAVAWAAGLRVAPIDGARVRRAVAASWATAVPVRGLALVVLLSAGVLAVLVWIFPPNNQDSLQYHLPRAITYLQQGSLDAYETPDLRETAFAANAEMLVLWQMALWPQVRTAGLVQLVAWLCSGPAVYALARRLGGGPAPSVLSGLVFMSLPAVILQATTEQNDLLAAVFVLCALALVSGDGSAHAALGALALGLAVGTKPTAFFAVPAFAMWAIAHARLRARGDVRVLGRKVAALAAWCVAGVAVCGAYIYVQNLRAYGHPSGPPAFAGVVTLDRHDPHVLWSNLGRLTLRLFEPEGIAPPGAFAERLNRVSWAVSHAAFRRLGIAKELPGIDYVDASSRWRSSPYVLIHDGMTAFGPVFALLWVPALVVAVRRGGTAVVLALGALVYLCALAAGVRWQYWSGRFSITFAALCAPLLAALLGGGGRRLSLARDALVAAACGACLYTCVLHNVSKPLLGAADIRGLDRISRLFLPARRDEAVLRMLESLDPPVARLAVVLDNPGHLRSVYFGERLQREVAMVRSASGPLGLSRWDAFDAVLLLGEGQWFYADGPGQTLPGRWWGFRDLRPAIDALRASHEWQPVVDEDGVAHFFVRGATLPRLSPSAPPYYPLSGELGGGWLAPEQRALVRVDDGRARLQVEGETGDFGFTQTLAIARPDGSTLVEASLPRAAPFRVSAPVQALVTGRPRLYAGLRLISGPAFNPHARGISADPRDLTVRVHRRTLAPETGTE